MSCVEHAEGSLEEVLKAGFRSAEVYLKSGRSRRFEMGPLGLVAGLSRESGWAIRGGGKEGSFFSSGVGLPRFQGQHTELAGPALLLPPAAPLGPWTEPAGINAPLVSESEGHGLLEEIRERLQHELPGSRLLWGVLDDGYSRGLRCSYRARSSSLSLEAIGPWAGTSSTRVYLAERTARGFLPGPIAQRLANRLLLGQKGRPPESSGRDLLLSPAVAVQILVALYPLFVGSEPMNTLRDLCDGEGRLGSEELTLVDDGRYPGGVLETPADGEGYPTGRKVLVERGIHRANLEARSEGRVAKRRSPGCMRRPGWRDMPRPLPSHFYVEADPSHSVSSLVHSVRRGHYLVEPLSGARIDPETLEFSVQACGFELRDGEATTPVSPVWVRGGLNSLLRGIRARGRDLSFFPFQGMIGAPTLLVSGLEAG